MIRHILSGIFLLLALGVARLPAQEIQWNDAPRSSASHAQRVTLDSDSLTVAAGKPDWLELRFHIARGFHINSHTPHDETLIPTALKLDIADRLHILGYEYPAGTPLHLDIGEGETLSTYQNEFRIRLHVVAQKGDSVLTGTLHYQACDSASCFPPRDLPLHIALSAR